MAENHQRLGVIPVSQPVFIIEYGDGFIRHLGPWRIQLTYPFRSFLERGIRLVFSSDCPVSDFAPLKSIQAAVTERTGSGQSYALEEAVTVGNRPAIVPSIGGWARMTGLNTIFIDDRDPFAHGFTVA